jgi:hypothetical protein
LSLRDEQVIEEINLFGVNIQRMLSGPGSFTGSFGFDQTGKNNADLVAATIPGRTWVVVERDDVPIWWGVVWSRTYQSQAKECQLFAWGFEAYPQKRKIDFSFLRTGQPNTQIFADLWTAMQAVPYSNINVNIPTNALGPSHDLAILPSDQLTFDQPMSQLADADDGFDWTIDLTKNSDGTYTKTLRIGYPTLGTDLTDVNSVILPTALVFEYPGNILNYYASEGMTDAGTNVFVMGAGEGSAMPQATTVQTDMLNQGWPRWDVDISLKDITDQAKITQIAVQEKTNRKPPMLSFTITAKGDQDPILGSFNVGDACLISITDSRFPSFNNNASGFLAPSVVLGYKITPPENDSTETYDVILPGDVVNG